MTVTSETSQVEYISDGVSVDYPIDFYFLEDTDIQVVVSDSDGTIYPMVLDVDYTITGEGNPSGGTLHFTIAQPLDFKIAIIRNAPATQLTDYQPNDDFPAKSHERALDKLTMLVQQLLLGISNSLRKNLSGLAWDFLGLRGTNVGVPVDPTDVGTKGYIDTADGKTVRTPEPIPVLPAAASRKGMLLGFDGAGNPYLAAAASGSATDLEARLRDPINPFNGAAIVAAPGAGTVAQALPMVSVAQFVGTDTQKLILACAQAVAQGHKRVFIPYPTYTVIAGTDCQFCELHGAGTSITGRLFNHSGLHNINVLGQNQSDIISAPTPYRDSSQKILWRQGTNKDYVFIQKENRGYCMLGFVRNQTTTSESLATSNTDPTRHRLGEVLNAVWVGVYKRTYSAISGTWTDTTTPGGFANVIPAFDSGRSLRHWVANQNGNYIEFSVKPRRGKFAFALYQGTTGAETATVSINGTVVSTITPVAAASNTIKRFYVDSAGVPDDVSATLRITHTGTNGRNLGVFGVNFYELKDWDGDESDSFAYFRNSIYADYLTQSSANDTVAVELVSSTYGISYHGGESAIISDWYVNDALQILTTDQFVPTRSVYLQNSATVSWAALGGGSLNISALWRMGVGGVSHEAQLTGNAILRDLYTHMYGNPESFSEIAYPSHIDLSSIPSDSRRSLGRTNRTIMRNPTTGQKISSEMTVYNREQNQYGGAHVWHVVGSYNKLYYGPCLGGRYQLTDVGLVSNYIFS